MRESELFEFGFGMAAIGGLAVGVLGFVYQLMMRRSASHSASPEAVSVFTDARIVACLSLVPQCCLLSLPAIYKSPTDVPKMLGPAAVFVGAMVVCVWIWMAIKIIKAGRTRAWYSRGNLLIFSGPALALVVAVMVYLSVGTR